MSSPRKRHVSIPEQEVGATIDREPDSLGGIVARAIPHGIDRVGFRLGQTVRSRRRARLTADIGVCIERAGPRVVDNPVLHTVVSVARVDRRVLHGRKLPGRNHPFSGWNLENPLYYNASVFPSRFALSCAAWRVDD
jgi:hypothetical protein